MSLYLKAADSAKKLAKSLKLFSWLHSVGVGGTLEAPILIIYSKIKIQSELLQTFNGFPVSLTHIGDVVMSSQSLY